MAKGNPFKEREQRLAAKAEKLSAQSQTSIKPIEEPAVPVVKIEEPPVITKTEPKETPRYDNMTNTYEPARPIEPARPKTNKPGRKSSATEETFPAGFRLTEKQLTAIEENVGRGRAYRDKSELVRDAIDKLLGL